MRMSLVEYDYDDNTTPKKKKDKSKPVRRGSTSLVEYDAEDLEMVDNSGHDGEVIIENQVEDYSEDDEDEDSQTDSPLGDPFMDYFKEQILKSSDFSSDLKTSTDTTSLKTSDYSALKTSDSIQVLEPITSPQAESSSKRIKTIDYSLWKTDYECPTDPPCPILVSKVTDYIEFKSSGTNINREYRRRKEFKNPNILEKLVEYYHIIEIGSNYPTDKFNPHKWNSSSFYEVLNEEQQKYYEQFEKQNELKLSSSGPKQTKSSSTSKRDHHKSSSKHSRRSPKERDHVKKR